MRNRGKREALILAVLSGVWAEDATGLAVQVIHERARARDILPTLRSMRRRGLVDFIPGEGKTSGRWQLKGKAPDEPPACGAYLGASNSTPETRRSQIGPGD